jgi:hypothetical protein
MDIREVEKFISENNEDRDVKLFLQKITDSRVTSALETYKTKTLPGLVDQELKKKTEVDREFQLSLKEKAIELSAETNIPYKVILRNLKGDETEDSEAIQDLQELVSKAKIEKATEM